ncbi:M24 family metallopeptidase [Marinilactibacillus kalidii]|uniref:M24 family metallopeptidase n=1 Tax=Marinilactibacillus kalidii TaxID=2820274 RepID=UPI001ABE79DE|nr:Xaa-Pro peptidase family protein [Marinilactibacillus kalidii]
MNQPIKNLKNKMALLDIDLIYIDDPSLVGYFTGFESDPHERVLALFLMKHHAFLFTPNLEAKDAKRQSSIETIISYKDEENPWAIIESHLSTYDFPIEKVGIIENNLTVERFNHLMKSTASPNTMDISSMIQEIQLIKSDDEIQRMIKAGKMADKALEIGMNALKVGISEQAVVAEIEYEMKKRGISEMSFQTMVLFGDHAGSPHGNPGERTLQENEFVLFDLGVVSEGYTSDVTRTVAFKSSTQEERDIYEVVLSAQKTAQAAVKPGITTGELDNIARSIIEKAGYGDYFTHRLGHGLGKTVHEYPSLSKGSEMVIKEGMCFSLEPGIYIENKIGVRIEDCVYVTAEGCIPFTQTSKEFITL